MLDLGLYFHCFSFQRCWNVVGIRLWIYKHAICQLLVRTSVITRSGMQMKFQSVNSIFEVRLADRGRRKIIRNVLFHSDLPVKFQNFFASGISLENIEGALVTFLFRMENFQLKPQVHCWQDLGSQKRRSEKKRARRRDGVHDQSWFAHCWVHALQYQSLIHWNENEENYRKKCLWCEKIGDFPASHGGITEETKPTDLCSLAWITLRGAPGGQLQSFGNLSNQWLLGEFQICGFFFGTRWRFLRTWHIKRCEEKKKHINFFRFLLRGV